MLKQSLDARHVRDRSGCHVGAPLRRLPLGLDIGGFLYHGSAIEARTSLKAVGGAELGNSWLDSNRACEFKRHRDWRPLQESDICWQQLPGDSKESDGFDNDFNGWIDDHGESDAQTLITLFPELGFISG